MNSFEKLIEVFFFLFFLNCEKVIPSDRIMNRAKISRVKYLPVNAFYLSSTSDTRSTSVSFLHTNTFYYFYKSNITVDNIWEMPWIDIKSHSYFCNSFRSKMSSSLADSIIRMLLESYKAIQFIECIFPISSPSPDYVFNNESASD